MSCWFVIFEVRKREKVLSCEQNKIIIKRMMFSVTKILLQRQVHLEIVIKSFTLCKLSRYLKGIVNKKSDTFVAISRKFGRRKNAQDAGTRRPLEKKDSH